MDLQTALMGAGAGGHFRQGASIGKNLFGGSQDAYDKSYQRAATVENTMLDARKKRDAEMGRANRKASMIAAGVSAEQADLLDSLLNAGDNPEQVSGYQLDQQKLGFGDRAMSVATDPASDSNLLNRMMQVISGKPVDLTKVDDHTFINPMVTPDQQDPDLTTLQGQLNAAKIDAQIQQGADRTAAQVRASGAQAGASTARGRASDALTDLRGRTDPNRSRGKPKPQGKTKVSAAAVKALWDNPQMAGQFKEKFGTAAFDAVMAQRP